MDARTIDESQLTSATSAETLIAHILQRYHAVHRDELPKLHRLAQKLEHHQQNHAACPRGLSELLADMRGELEHHMQREETVLFPTLLAGGGGCAPFAMRRMRAEHDDHGILLQRLASITNNFTCPPNADAMWQALYAGCAKLDSDLREHIRIENEQLFPLFE